MLRYLTILLLIPMTAYGQPYYPSQPQNLSIVFGDVPLPNPAIGVTVSVELDTDSPYTPLPHVVDQGSSMLIVGICGWAGSSVPIDSSVDPQTYSVGGVTWTAGANPSQSLTAANAPDPGGWGGLGAQEAVQWYSLSAPDIGAGNLTFGDATDAPDSGLTFVAFNVSVATSVKSAVSSSSAGPTTTVSMTAGSGELMLGLLVTDNSNTVSWSGSPAPVHAGALYNGAKCEARSYEDQQPASVDISGASYPGLTVISVGTD